MQSTRSSKRLNPGKEVDVEDKSAPDDSAFEEVTVLKLKRIRKATAKVAGIQEETRVNTQVSLAGSAGEKTTKTGAKKGRKPKENLPPLISISSDLLPDSTPTPKSSPQKPKALPSSFDSTEV